MEKLSNTFLDFYGDVKLNNRLKEVRAMLAWDKIVGEHISRNSEPIKVYSGTLYVSVKSSSWTQELKGLEQEIVRQINEHLHCEIIKEIRFFQKALHKKDTSDMEDENASLREKQHVKISQQDKDKAEKIAGEIEDENLRKAFYEFLTKDIRFQKSTNKNKK